MIHVVTISVNNVDVIYSPLILAISYFAPNILAGSFIYGNSSYIQIPST